MIKISVVGIGNAGNQVADLAKKKYDIDGIAINSSQTDISTVKNINKITVGDEKGSGKDRNIAKRFIQQSTKNLIGSQEFKEVVADKDIVFVVSSTGGGTGSGMGPVFTDILSRVFKNTKFITIGILPPLKESIAAQQNTIEYMKEILSFNPTYMLYDNNNRAKLTTSEMMIDVNNEIVDDISVFRGDYQPITPYNSIDEKDMMKIVDTPGRIVIGKLVGLKEKDIDDKSIEDRLISAIHNSTHAELERDQIIKRIGLITNLSPKLYKSLDSGLPALKELVGEPIEAFEHVYVNSNNDEVNRVIAIMSGLSVPDDRIQKVMQRIDEATMQLSKTKESNILNEVNTDFVTQLRDASVEVRDNNEESVDLDEIFGRYMK